MNVTIRLSTIGKSRTGAAVPVIELQEYTYDKNVLRVSPTALTTENLRAGGRMQHLQCESVGKCQPPAIYAILRQYIGRSGSREDRRMEETKLGRLGEDCTGRIYIKGTTHSDISLSRVRDPATAPHSNASHRPP